MKGGISGGWALAVDEPQINKAENNQKAILCPEGPEQVLCAHRSSILTEHRVRLDGVLRRPHGINTSEDTGCIFKKMSSTCKEDKMTIYSNYLEKHREATPAATVIHYVARRTTAMLLRGWSLLSCWGSSCACT